MTTPEPHYDVALSFAGENREYVESVASRLRDLGVKVFYDNYEQVALWGKDLYAHLDWIYRTASRYCVVFISQHYADKVWTTHERRSAQARAINENVEYVLPVRFDDTEIEGVLPTVGYINLKTVAPERLADMIQEKLGPRRSSKGFPTKTERLWESLEVAEDDESERDRVWDIAYSVYQAFERMSEEERVVVGAILVFGCEAELPKSIHMSLDLLRRFTGLPRAQIIECLRAVRVLNFRAKQRPPVHNLEEGDLAPDDVDITLSFGSPQRPEAADATKVARHTARAAADHFCEDHGLEVLKRADFHHLSFIPEGPYLVE